MAKIISVVNEKGGCGKSTTSLGLACALQAAGLRVLLIDGDPQGSLRDWSDANAQHSAHVEIPAVVALDRANGLIKDARKLAGQFDVAIVDSAPQSSELAGAAIRVADLIVIPCQPSPFDVWASASTVEIVKARQAIADTPAYFLVSRQIVGTKLASDVRQALDSYELPILDSVISQRVAFLNSAMEGQSVVTFPDSGEARAEVTALAAEIMGLLGLEATA